MKTQLKFNLKKAMNGGHEAVWNVLQRNEAQLNTWSRFHISG